MKIPILGICYGAQLIAHQYGANIEISKIREYGKAKLTQICSSDALLQGIPSGSTIWMSHSDTMTTVSEKFEIIASTSAVKVAAFKLQGQKTWGIQFHPEVSHSIDGKVVFKNFLINICGCAQDWTPQNFIKTTIASLQQRIGADQAVLALSGGVDSTVAALLLHKAIGQRLHCIFVDNGLLRKNEFKTVLASYEGMGLSVQGVNAQKQFYHALQGLADPEQKRKAIGKTFIDVFEAATQKITGVQWLGQGTIYPDVIESVTINGPSATIKSHHNVGGLPESMHLKLIEPLRWLFKDEVRKIGQQLGMPLKILQRHPFPGPGLAVRILGEVSEKKVKILQAADHIFINALQNQGLYDKVWQAGVILLPVQSVGVMGDQRTYEYVVSLRAVTSVDGMTADWAKLSHDFLHEVANEMINTVQNVNRVVYDISSKPPATIEWE